MTTLDIERSRRDAAATRPLGLTFPVLTVERLIYFVIGIISLVAHLWGLGERALHHDETLHAAFSWYIYQGRGYIHDPLLHGPFLYFLNAAIYFVFGDNDFTARLGAALFGTALSLTPYLFRREIGRPAAIIAALLMTLSPVFLYVGRFIRHDIYSVVFEVLIFAAIVRYASTRKAGWLYLGMAAFALMLVNQETAYLFALIMGAPLAVLFLWRLWKPGIALVAALGLAGGLLAFVLPGTAVVDGSHAAQRDANGQMVVESYGPLFGWGPLESEDNNWALRIRNRADNSNGSLIASVGQYFRDIGPFFAHPAVLSGMFLSAVVIAVLVWAIWYRRDTNGQSSWQRLQGQDDPWAQAIVSLGSDRRLWFALALAFGIYVFFFTAVFTNLLGIVTGVAGSLLYWLAQHNVERGGQPEHYYLVQLLVYEPLLLLWTGIGALLLGRDAWRDWQDHKAHRAALAALGEGDEAPPAPVRRLSFAPLLLAWWSLTAFGIYTWAGEKMPWLTIHIALPLALFSAWTAGRVIFPHGRLPAAGGETSEARLAWPLYAGGFAAIVALGYILLTAYLGSTQEGGAALVLVLLFIVGLLLALSGLAAWRWSWRWAVAALALCTTLSLGFYELRGSLRLAYRNGDVPREMLVYTQTSPDVVRVVRRLEEASLRRGGQLAMPILYDNETVWTWYLRNFSAAQATGGVLSAAPGPEIQAVFLLQENLDRNPQNRDLLNGFVIQRFPLRWWMPEEQTYRLSDDWQTRELSQLSIVGRFLRDPWSNETQRLVWGYLLNRDPNVGLGSTDFVIAVRPELAEQIGLGLGGSLVPTP